MEDSKKRNGRRGKENRMGRHFWVPVAVEFQYIVMLSHISFLLVTKKDLNRPANYGLFPVAAAGIHYSV